MICQQFPGLVAVVIALACLCLSTGEALQAKEPGKPVPFYEGLGGFGRKVTTSSRQAQRYFDQGLCFLYAFNHDEAIRSFQVAAELDPKCAMAWWGIALASGPHINNPVVPPERSQVAWQALTKAKQSASQGTKVEQALIEALVSRYADPAPEDRRPLDEAFAAAMRRVWQQFPDDADVGAIFAESMMDLRPWDLWLPTGEPQPGTEEIVATLEKVLRRAPKHPLALHLYIHAVEASPTPERAIEPADRLRDLQPGLGHLVHMPSHIDVRTGRWLLAIEANAKAIQADRRYREQSPNQGFYHVYMAHNHHMLAYGAIMRGQSKLAIDTVRDMVAGMPLEWMKQNPMAADGFYAMPLEMLVRFGRWEEALAVPEPPEYLPVSRALRHVARGISYAAQGEIEKAREEQTAFIKAKSLVPAETPLGNNKAADVLTVAEHLLQGEILVRAGELESGLEAMRQAVKHEDQLRYSEPPDWIHPVRHALGATLLTAGRAAEAEKVYAEDLARLPNNGWSLLGMARSLHLQQREAEARKYDDAFQAVWRDADIKITSSCFCQIGR